MRPHQSLAALLVALLVSHAYGCAGMWQTAKSVAAPAGGAAAGAVVGSLAGPAGTLAGAAIGGGAGALVDQNASLRSGETIGEGARSKEQARWKGLTPAEWESVARNASNGKDWAQRWAWRIGLLAAAYVAFLKRESWWAVVVGSMRDIADDGVEIERSVSRGHALRNALVGGRKNRARALGRI